MNKGEGWRYGMAEYSKQELMEATRSLASTLAKCEKALSGLDPRAKSQRTLLERRIAAIRIALRLITNEAEAQEDREHNLLQSSQAVESSSGRADSELPRCVVQWGWQFHHLGVPTAEQRPDERYLPQFGFYVSGFPTSPVGVEWMRFAPDSPIEELIQQVPHLAFVVDDLDQELAAHGLEVLTPPNPPSQGVRVAMVVIDGAPVELMEFNSDQ